MTKRDQSPHYIPELDPDSPESGPKDRQPWLWFLFIGGSVLLLTGGGAYVAGFEKIGLIIGGIGVLMLAILMPGLG